MKAKTTFSLKDQLFNPEKVAYLTDLFAAVYPAFPSVSFQQMVVDAFPQLELKARIEHIAVCLQKSLPPEYLTALDIILRALPPELDACLTDDDFGDFIIAPLNHFVAMYGCSAENLTPSLNALKTITKRFSAEDAIRYFINAFPDETVAFLQRCSADENYHVRRLASEGTRAKLPWSQKLVIDYKVPLPILNALYADNTRYVTRSVANHLNDVSKLDPTLVVETLARWQKSGQQREKEMAFIVKHSLRTLVKQGNQDALALLGFGETPEVTIRGFSTHTPTVKIGEAFEFVLTIESHKAQNIMADYVMRFASNGNKRGRKVFKLKQVALSAGQTIAIKKKHPMRLMTTRRLYEGTHEITLQLNGQAHGTLAFELVA
ncbi:MAG: DNA alkylation repair protein [Candidatus Promineifilaceae bacterium]